MIVVLVHYLGAPEVFCATGEEIVARATSKSPGDPAPTQSRPSELLMSEFAIAWNHLTDGLKDARLFEDKTEALAYFEAPNARLTATERLGVITAINRLHSEPDHDSPARAEAR